MTLNNIIRIGFLSILFFSCNRIQIDVDASDINIDTKYINLDSCIYNSNEKDLIKNHNTFKNNIKDIYSYQLGYILQIGNVSDTAFIKSITQYKNDPGIQKIEKRIKEKFNNLEKHKLQINEGLKHLKYHFPKGKIPENIVFMNSLLQSNAFCTEKEIGIGLDRYLGQKIDVIKELPSEPFYDWIKESMDVQFLERDALCSWIITHYIEEDKGTLAESIIRWGKIIYLTEASFPNYEKNIIIRYSINDYNWAIKNEYTFWKYLVDQKLLFKNNELDKANLLKEAPFTTGLPNESPDRFAQFIGWQIVRNYMSKNEITLEQLLKVPYNNILQEYEIKD